MARKRARTKDGHFIADDPNTPENEAWTEDNIEAPKPKKEKKAAPKKAAAPAYSMWISSEPENGAWDIRLGDDIKIKGTWDIQRAYVTWKIPTDLLEMAKQHHHIWSGRIVELDEEE
jgi:hypothetical protein